VTGGSGADRQAITARSGCHIGTVSATSICSLGALNISHIIFQTADYFFEELYNFQVKKKGCAPYIYALLGFLYTM
jgi:hypothetical protein